MERRPTWRGRLTALAVIVAATLVLTTGAFAATGEVTSSRCPAALR